MEVLFALALAIGVLLGLGYILACWIWLFQLAGRGFWRAVIPGLNFVVMMRIAGIRFSWLVKWLLLFIAVCFILSFFVFIDHEAVLYAIHFISVFVVCFPFFFVNYRFARMYQAGWLTSTVFALIPFITPLILFQRKGDYVGTPENVTSEELNVTAKKESKKDLVLILGITALWAFGMLFNNANISKLREKLDGYYQVSVEIRIRRIRDELIALEKENKLTSTDYITIMRLQKKFDDEMITMDEYAQQLDELVKVKRRSNNSR